MKKELGIFIDESGDFGEYDPKCPYYIISMVFHNQADDLSALFRSFDYALTKTASKNSSIHMGPLIRREGDYVDLTIEERLQIYRRTKTFIEKVEFTYENFVVEKKHVESGAGLAVKMEAQITNFIRRNYQYFARFDKVKVYYDNGQDGVAKIIRAIFTRMLSSPEIKVAKQQEYKLLQVADFVCTAKLTELKMEHKAISRSERRLLGDDKMINRIMLKPLRRKKFTGEE